MTTLVLALGLTACDLGEKQIGDESGTDDGGDADADADADPIGPCGEVMISSLPSNSEDDFADPLDAFGGRSVDDILAIVEGNYAGTFTWDQPEDPVFVLADHAGTESPLTITATFAGGDAVLTRGRARRKMVQQRSVPDVVHQQARARHHARFCDRRRRVRRIAGRARRREQPY
jgi:hypothetical protein